MYITTKICEGKSCPARYIWGEFSDFTGMSLGPLIPLKKDKPPHPGGCGGDLRKMTRGIFYGI